MTTILYESPNVGVIGLGHFGKALATGLIDHTYCGVMATSIQPVEWADSRMGKQVKMCADNKEFGQYFWIDLGLTSPNVVNNYSIVISK